MKALSKGGVQLVVLQHAASLAEVCGQICTNPEPGDLIRLLIPVALAMFDRLEGCLYRV